MRPKQSYGVYMEHYAHNVTFYGFSITGAKAGFSGAWAGPASGGSAGAQNVTTNHICFP